MDDEDKKKKKKESWEDIFDSMDMNGEFKKMQKLAEEIMKKSIDDLDKNPFVCGFTVSPGSNGIPNIKSIDREHFHRRDQEPLSDVQDCGNEVLVTVDIPGVEKKEIDVKTKGRKLTISTHGSREYHTEIDLPAEVDIDCSEAIYLNGVLEIRLKKIDDSEHSIEVE
ncbi:MAG: Hsp20/alpha crystallin family protein [Thermoplasmata archaeon]